ncbi:hypothetical protein AGMMS50268_12570 [Spirochaetia bacterium]|nr:hypothetical protein AGMMS50268_12570 [Spirochaetia bacterium]
MKKLLVMAVVILSMSCSRKQAAPEVEHVYRVYYQGEVELVTATRVDTWAECVEFFDGTVLKVTIWNPSKVEIVE